MVKNYKREIVIAGIIPVLIGMVMCLFFWLDNTQHWQLYRWGVFPRTFNGLFGIVLSPFIHGSLNHLWSNLLPFILVGWSLFYYHRKIAFQILTYSFILTGFWLWLAARPSYHIGASGVLYSLVVFTFFIGIWSKQKKLIAFSLLVAFLYGSMFWGIFPVKDNVSWEAHLWGSVAGFILAWFYRGEVVKEENTIVWEEEDYELEQSNYHRLGQTNSTIPGLHITYEMEHKKSSSENKDLSPDEHTIK